MLRQSPPEKNPLGVCAVENVQVSVVCAGQITQTTRIVLPSGRLSISLLKQPVAKYLLWVLQHAQLGKSAARNDTLAHGVWQVGMPESVGRGVGIGKLLFDRYHRAASGCVGRCGE